MSAVVPESTQAPVHPRQADVAAVTGEVGDPVDGCGCREQLLELFADRGIEMVVSAQPPLVPSLYEDLGLRCPHHTRWYTEPTSDQQLAWAVAAGGSVPAGQPAADARRPDEDDGMTVAADPGHLDPLPVPDPLPFPAVGPAVGGRPVRIQRRRARGWRMPDGAVYVGRPGRWGNPYRLDGTAGGRAAAVAAHAALLAADPALRAAVVEQLRARDLACWCPPGQPCHADTLLAIANPTQLEAMAGEGERGTTALGGPA